MSKDVYIGEIDEESKIQDARKGKSKGENFNHQQRFCDFYNTIYLSNR